MDDVHSREIKFAHLRREIGIVTPTPETTKDETGTVVVHKLALSRNLEVLIRDMWEDWMSTKKK